MKRYSLIIGLTVVLATLLCYMLFFNNVETDASSEKFSDFAIADTSLVETFIISDAQNNSIIISRKEDGKTWMIGETGIKAQLSSVDLITETFQRIRVKQDVPEVAINNVLTSLAVRHKKVEIFLKGEDKPHKTWFVGSATNDHLGTYMLLKIGDQRSAVPYITHKQDMYGTLEVRFYTNFQKWRSSAVFSYPSNSIEEISVKFNDDIQNSYTIKVKDENTVELFDNVMSPIATFDSSQVKHYLTHYKKIHYNAINNELTQDQVDSVFALTPNYEISVKGVKGNNTDVKVWKMRYPGTSPESNKQIVWDPERAWCRINGSNEIFKVQYYSWDVLFKPLAYYIKK